jgi:hypothetical protein
MTKPYFQRFSDRLAVGIAFAVLSLLVYGVLCTFGWFAQPKLSHRPEYAVVKLPSHGASATVVHTDEVGTWLLTAAHMFRNEAGKSRPIQIDFCNEHVPVAASKAAATIVLCADGVDLCLIKLDYGPVPFTAPVAPELHAFGRCVSCGYDGMRRPAGNGPFVSIASDDAWGNGYTSMKAKGAPGRSGGAIIEPDTGFLVGVIQGGEAERTNFTPHQLIVLFLKTQNHGWLIPTSGRLANARPVSTENHTSPPRRMWQGFYSDLSDANPLMWVLCLAPFVVTFGIFLVVFYSIQTVRQRVHETSSDQKPKKPHV